MKDLKFGTANKDFSDYKNSKIVIMPVPFEGTVSYGKGTSKGPEAIITASRFLEAYDIELDRYIPPLGIHTVKMLSPKKNAESMVESVYESAKKELSNGKFIVMIGGEHSLTPGIVKAYKEKYDQISVLQIDAHSDLRKIYQDNAYSHACAMSHVRKLCPIVQVGIRSMDISEENIDRDKIFFAEDIMDNDAWMQKAVSLLSENVYITIDVDGLDTSIMPSTGTPEPGGLLWYQTLKLLRLVAENKNIIGFDVVELSPIKGMNAPDFLAARLIYKLLGYAFYLKRKK